MTDTLEQIRNAVLEEAAQRAVELLSRKSGDYPPSREERKAIVDALTSALHHNHIIEQLRDRAAKRAADNAYSIGPDILLSAVSEIGRLRIEVDAKETEALGYLRAVGTLQARIAELEKSLGGARAAALEEAAKALELAAPTVETPERKVSVTTDSGEFLGYYIDPSWKNVKFLTGERAAKIVRAIIPEKKEG